MKKLWIGLPVLLVVVGLALAYALSKAPALELTSATKVIGFETPVKIRVVSPHGIRKVTAWIEQNGKRTQIFESSAPARRSVAFRDSEAPREVSFSAGKKQAESLQDGPAKLIVAAVANDFGARSAELIQL
ncbi:MAG: hypothetical protein WKF37_06390 [Bryobacteraceae bacterium]